MTQKKMFLIKHLIKQLTILKVKPLENIEINVSEMLDIIYELSIEKIEFTEGEQCQIGSLIKDAIKAIDTCIFINE